MYVRWKKRALHRRVHTGKYQWKVSRAGNRYAAPIWRDEPTGNYALSAQLVESRRVDGKPRQKVIKYLGTIDSHRISVVSQRIYFWRHVGAALQALGLPPEQQRSVELTLHAHVPFPTAEEVAQVRAEIEHLTASIRARL